MRIVLETPRLFLREMTFNDLDFLAEMYGDAEVMRYYPKPLNRKEAEESIEKNIARYQQHGFGMWLVLLKANALPIGRVGLVRQQIDGQAEDEIGYMIHRPYWQQGFAREAACGVRRYAQGTLGKTRVISLIRPINIPSQRTALSIGLKPEKITMFANLEHLLFSINNMGSIEA